MSYNFLFPLWCLLQCHTVCHGLPQRWYEFCCCVLPYSLLFVVTCHTVCYTLPHAVQLIICHAVSYLLLPAVQFAIHCRMPCSLFVAAYCAVCSLLPHGMQFAFCCCMLCSLLFVATCHAVCYCVQNCWPEACPNRFRLLRMRPIKCFLASTTFLRARRFSLVLSFSSHTFHGLAEACVRKLFQTLFLCIHFLIE